MKTPRLLIGLGASGLQVVAQVLARWRESFPDTEPPGVLGVSFQDPPAGFPAESHVRLSSDVGAALERLQNEPAPHIAGWLNADTWLNRWYHYRSKPRALERLLWVEEIGRGDRSSLYRLWLRELRRIHSDRAILAFMIADLSEEAGSGLLADAAFLTRVIAEVETNSEIRIWGYTLLPTGAASDEDRLRASAALREIARLNSAHDDLFGEPFYYRPPTAHRIDERIWRGSLKVKPFDLWYCFDGTHEAVNTISGVISSYLSADAYDKALNHLINVGARVTLDRVYVGAVNVRTISLPITAFQRTWAAKLAIQLTAGLLRETGEAPNGDRYWRGLPSAQGLEIPLLTGRIPKQGADAYVALFDQGLFGSVTLVPQANDSGVLILRGDSDFPEPRSLDLDTLCRQEDILRRRVDRLRAAKDNPYAQLVNQAVQRRVDFFRGVLSEYLEALLETDGLVQAIDALESLRIQANTMTSALSQTIRNLERPSESETQVYQQLGAALRTLANLCSENPGLLERHRHLTRSREALAAAQVLAHRCMTYARWSLLAVALTTLTSEYRAALDVLYTSLIQWQSALKTWNGGWREQKEHAYSAFGGDWQVSSSADDRWGKQQFTRLAEKNPVVPLRWNIDSPSATVTLVLEDTILTPENGKSLLDERMNTIFAEARLSSTLLAYLQQENVPLDDLIAFLMAAESLPLDFSESSDTIQGAFGRLVAPEDLNPERRRLVRDLEIGLKAAYNVAPDDDSRIQRQVHDSQHQLVYSNSVERIDLTHEVRTYTELEKLYQRYTEETPYYHALGGEVTAGQVELLLQASGSPIKLSPRAVSALADRSAVYTFFSAYLLDVIDYSPQPTGLNSYQFGYRLLLPEITLWLTQPLPASAPVLWDALKAFSASQQVSISGQIIPLPLPRDQIDAFVYERWQAAVRELVPQSLADNGGDDIIRVWLERAFQRSTPSNLHSQVIQTVAEILLLRKFQVQLAENTQPHRDNPVQNQLYQVGAALLDERQKTLRKQMAEIIGGLASLA